MKDIITNLKTENDRLRASAKFYERQGSELFLKGIRCLSTAEELRVKAREVRSSVEVLERFVEASEGPTK